MRALVTGLLRVLFPDCCFLGPSCRPSITLDSEELPLDAASPALLLLSTPPRVNDQINGGRTAVGSAPPPTPGRDPAHQPWAVWDKLPPSAQPIKPPLVSLPTLDTQSRHGGATCDRDARRCSVQWALHHQHPAGGR